MVDGEEGRFDAVVVIVLWISIRGYGAWKLRIVLNLVCLNVSSRIVLLCGRMKLCKKWNMQLATHLHKQTQL